MEIHEKLKILRKAKDLTQEQISAALDIKRGAYAAYESGRVNMDSDLLQKVAKEYSVTLEALINPKDRSIQSYLKEHPKPYHEQRRDNKINGSSEPIFPAYVGSTKMGKLEVYSYTDDPEMQEPVGFFDGKLFPGCDHAEKVSGSSMYPLIVSQGWVIGKIIDKRGIISGEKYVLHTKYKENVVKYVQPSERGEKYIKIISHNKKIPDQDLKLDDITFCMRVFYIINPA